MLKESIDGGVVTLGFVKKDGSQRLMRCTRNFGLIPSFTPKKESNTESSVLRVYDIDAKGWRSFNENSVEFFYEDYV